jgi:hypothetical protein
MAILWARVKIHYVPTQAHTSLSILLSSIEQFWRAASNVTKVRQVTLWLIKQNAAKIVYRWEQIHSWGGWLDSRYGRLNRVERAHVTRWLGRWAHCREDRYAVEDRKIVCSSRILRHDPAVQIGEVTVNQLTKPGPVQDGWGGNVDALRGGRRS